MSLKKVLMITAALGILVYHNPKALADEPQHGDPDWPNIIYIEPGTKWEMEVKSSIFTDESAFTVNQWIEGTEDINDKIYYKLWSQVKDETPEIISYLRIDKLNYKIFAVSPENMDRDECLVYSFYTGSAPQEIVSMSWDGKLSDETYLFKAKKDGELDFSNLVGFKYPIMKVSLYNADDIDLENCIGTVDWYVGIGTPSGLTNQCYCLDTEYTTILRKVYHNGEQLVYDMPTARINDITDNSPADGIKYRPDGTRFNDGDKGIYIMNSKKYIRY